MHEMALHDGPLGGLVMAGPRAPHRIVVLTTGPGGQALYRITGQDAAGVWQAEFVRMLPSPATKD
ncbi:hypothetical protein ACWC5I_19865 [Kitasatospora sp. NPDC001574]